ncbi:peptide/nickel transport system permease protein [Haloactinopolyspora alba]|uniref:Peptide/nickel transport system permease protein n=1 Tax=Haloactinopolyspora alba TaxID=648780 RepID=A0A2P8DV89_9ACTN|nr:ABC transporter permease [Haloactinopolyspora alba]PSL01153.1 peptide/nickel transport system permease protein [Haloactinopolyspora alba]
MAGPADTDLVPHSPEEGVRDRSGLYSTARYVGARLGGSLVSLFAVIVTSFFLFRIIPGDPVDAMTHGRPVSIEQKQQLRREFGLDDPLYQQFLDYLWGVVRLDFGQSFQFSRPVTELIGERLWPTLLLVGTAVAISALIGLTLGVNGAWRHGSTSDRVNTGLALTLWSVPSFWLGLILIVVFSSTLGWFPTSGMRTEGVSGWEAVPDVAHHMVLPVVTLVAVLYAQYLMIMRSSLLDEMGSDYIVTARAKGLRDALVRRRHAVPNALLPTVTLIFVNLGFVVFGSVLVETIFSWPGLGQLFYSGLNVPDLPLVQGLFVFFSAAVILMNLLADLLYPVIDPRVRP